MIARGSANPQIVLPPKSPYYGRQLSNEQLEDSFSCMGCDVEMIDSDPDFVDPQTKDVFCCFDCAEHHYANR
ncbi:hypothetical protein [Reinekea sp. G2M2-21]|uniref:hypothetical protein n=1 Tax=Reinekea sp. G2M2-21 TaxID=2788942 RepID=UPI0018AA9BD3|nr:hypothetical protein [Reinekea sp. G2M2-21]